MSLANRILRYQSFLKNEFTKEAKELAEKYPDVLSEIKEEVKEEVIEEVQEEQVITSKPNKSKKSK
jgi:ribosomal protein S17E